MAFVCSQESAVTTGGLSTGDDKIIHGEKSAKVVVEEKTVLVADYDSDKSNGKDMTLKNVVINEQKDNKSDGTHVISTNCDKSVKNLSKETINGKISIQSSVAKKDDQVSSESLSIPISETSLPSESSISTDPNLGQQKCDEVEKRKLPGLDNILLNLDDIDVDLHQLHHPPKPTNRRPAPLPKPDGPVHKPNGPGRPSKTQSQGSSNPCMSPLTIHPQHHPQQLQQQQQSMPHSQISQQQQQHPQMHSQMIHPMYSVNGNGTNPSLPLVQAHEPNAFLQARYLCKECGKGYNNKSSLRSHLKTIHAIVETQLKCSQCDFVTQTEKQLHRHMETHNPNRERPFPCDQCELQFFTVNQLKEHIKLHSTECNYICPQCNKAFKTKLRLKQHLDVHNPKKPFVCDMPGCERAFRTEKYLKNHKDEFHKLQPKRFECPLEECESVFYKRTHLKRHMHIHGGDKPFKCSWEGCGKTFRSNDSLKTHNLKHTGERPFSCQLCPYSCRQKISLLNHHHKSHSNHVLPQILNSIANKSIRPNFNDDDSGTESASEGSDSGGESDSQPPQLNPFGCQGQDDNCLYGFSDFENSNDAPYLGNIDGNNHPCNSGPKLDTQIDGIISNLEQDSNLLDFLDDKSQTQPAMGHSHNHSHKLSHSISEIVNSGSCTKRHSTDGEGSTTPAKQHLTSPGSNQEHYSAPPSLEKSDSAGSLNHQQIPDLISSVTKDQQHSVKSEGSPIKPPSSISKSEGGKDFLDEVLEDIQSIQDKEKTRPKSDGAVLVTAPPATKPLDGPIWSNDSSGYSSGQDTSAGSAKDVNKSIGPIPGIPQISSGGPLFRHDLYNPYYSPAPYAAPNLFNPTQYRAPGFPSLHPAAMGDHLRSLSALGSKYMDSSSYAPPPGWPNPHRPPSATSYAPDTGGAPVSAPGGFNPLASPWETYSGGNPTGNSSSAYEYLSSSNKPDGYRTFPEQYRPPSELYPPQALYNNPLYSPRDQLMYQSSKSGVEPSLIPPPSFYPGGYPQYRPMPSDYITSRPPMPADPYRSPILPMNMNRYPF